MKMLRYLGLLFCTASILSGCLESNSDSDKDGVPKVDLHGHAIVKREKMVSVGAPVYQDREYRMVTVKGKDMSLEEFINTYCLGKEMTNETCVRAGRIKEFDRFGSPDGKLQPLPAGL